MDDALQEGMRCIALQRIAAQHSIAQEKDSEVPSSAARYDVVGLRVCGFAVSRW